MRKLLNPAAIIAGVLLCHVAYTAAQTDFDWNGQLAPGQSIEVKGINGEVHALAARNGDVSVTAVRSARKSNPAEVRFEVVPHAGGVTICAVYPAPPGQQANECRSGGGGRSSTRDNDTVVDFTVHVPRGVNFIGRTVNGSVNGDSLQGNAEGYTVNGSVALTAMGLTRANTVNGSITSSMGRADWPDGASFKTVNGEITLRIPATANAELHARSVNGNIRSEFPVAVTGQINRRSLDGTIGSGGPKLDLSTVNGSISLLKGQ